jgi:hypothetical protein
MSHISSWASPSELVNLAGPSHCPSRRVPSRLAPLTPRNTDGPVLLPRSYWNSSLQQDIALKDSIIRERGTWRPVAGLPRVCRRTVLDSLVVAALLFISVRSADLGRALDPALVVVELESVAVGSKDPRGPGELVVLQASARELQYVQRVGPSKSHRVVSDFLGIVRIDDGGLAVEKASAVASVLALPIRRLFHRHACQTIGVTFHKLQRLIAHLEVLHFRRSSSRRLRSYRSTWRVRPVYH